MTRAELKAAGYWAPTPGEDVGSWNVFPVDGPASANVPFGDLPDAVRQHLAERR